MAELVSKTYSEALFEAAQELNQLDQICEEFDFVAACIEEYPDFYEILKTPQINLNDKKAVFKETFADKISETLLNFFYVLFDKKRVGSVLEIKSAFDKKVDTFRDILKVTVESVYPLSEEDLSRLTEKIKNKTGKKVIVSTLVSPAILGGLIIRFDDRVIDGSVKYKLEGMLEELTQIIV